ncbi:hypothetical protein CDL15_Pgr013671 [Punica granatum]|uniref:Alpha-mannosidase n=1 Tax=Punica granatum TaxID=22663 RepID=A0A218W0V5_PUNGR|nr:hypothetical protein CDL15_Pgr013671 [Punica granatum]
MRSGIALLAVVVLWAASIIGRGVDGAYLKYNTSGGLVQGKLNVHLVPHSHDDVGWLKTIDQYYVGSNNSIQGACVENTIDSLVESLLRDPNRKFIYAEMAFFERWWVTQSPETQEQVKKLVDSGRLEFVNGGWCMHDEAATHYVDMIDQTTLGHLLIKEHFNKVPRAGWQIDPFGHSAVQGYLLGAELGFDSVHFARIDYQDRAKRKVDKSLEVVWRGSNTFRSSSQIFANAFPVHYSPPQGFSFEVSNQYDPVQDNRLLFDYNVQQRVDDFISAAITQANVTRTNHIMWTMGDDFQYQYAESWFKQMDKLIHYVKKDGRVNALYSTPSLYIDAKNAENISWPLKTDDYFPYADNPNAYWTGYFTSRPALKGYVRMLSGYYLAARQLEFLVGKRSAGPTTYSLGDALGIAQHHDAVSGTAKQHTTNDYAKRLAIGATEAEEVVNDAVSCLVSNKSGQCQTPTLTLSQVIVAYNPLGWNRTDIIRIPVNDMNLVVEDSSGSSIETQYMELDNVTINLRNFYTQAYLGTSPTKVPKYWLLIQASLPPLGWNTYFVSKASAEGKNKRRFGMYSGQQQNDTIEIGQGNLKMLFSSNTGQLVQMYNIRTGVYVPVQQSYLYYSSSTGDIDPQVPLKVVRGPLVDEVHQQFSSWIYQVTRLYKDKEHAEVEFTIGPIPVEDGVGKEVITKMTANMATNRVFYTDSNGRDFLKRVRDHRQDWPLNVTQPVAGNYYPINLGIYTTDQKSEFSVLVDRSVGGASIKDGEVELMLHRRMLQDDARGVGEALDETDCIGNDTCQGLTNLENWRASYLTKGTAMDPSYNLPPNVALITLQELDDGNILLRLAHLFEAGEDVNYSTLAKVELKKMFVRKMIKGLKEMSLSANQEKSAMKRMDWKVEGDGKEGSSPAPVRGGPVDNSTLVIELGPMEIRTFLLNF